MNGPNPLLPFILLFVLAATVFLAVRLCRSYRVNLHEAGRGGSTGVPQASWGTWALLIVLMAAFLHFQPGTLRYRVRDVSSPGNMSMPPGLVPALLGGILLLSLGTYVRASFRPNGRVARLIARGRFDAAEALLRSRLTRRQARAGLPPSIESPFAAPAASSPADPQDEAEDWNHLGLIAMNRRDWPEAIGCFERAEAIGLPGDFILRNNRGLALIAAGRIDEGTALVERAIAEILRDQAETRSLLLLALAGRLIEAGRTDQAGPILDRAEAERQRAIQPSRSARREFDARFAAARGRIADSQGVGWPERPTLGGPPS